MSYKTLTQIEKYFEGFKGSTWKFTWMVWNAMHRYLWWTHWNNLVFRVLEARAAFPLSTSEG